MYFNYFARNACYFKEGVFTKIFLFFGKDAYEMGFLFRATLEDLVAMVFVLSQSVKFVYVALSERNLLVVTEAFTKCKRGQYGVLLETLSSLLNTEFTNTCLDFGAPPLHPLDKPSP